MRQVALLVKQFIKVRRPGPRRHEFLRQSICRGRGIRVTKPSSVGRHGCKQGIGHFGREGLVQGTHQFVDQPPGRLGGRVDE